MKYDKSSSTASVAPQRFKLSSIHNLCTITTVDTQLNVVRKLVLEIWSCSTFQAATAVHEGEVERILTKRDVHAHDSNGMTDLSCILYDYLCSTRYMPNHSL